MVCTTTVNEPTFRGASVFKTCCCKQLLLLVLFSCCIGFFLLLLSSIDPFYVSLSTTFVAFHIWSPPTFLLRMICFLAMRTGWIGSSFLIVVVAWLIVVLFVLPPFCVAFIGLCLFLKSSFYKTSLPHESSLFQSL